MGLAALRHRQETTVDTDYPVPSLAWGDYLVAGRPPGEAGIICSGKKLPVSTISPAQTPNPQNKTRRLGFEYSAPPESAQGKDR